MQFLLRGPLPEGLPDRQTDVKPLDISLFMENLTESEIIGAGGTVPDISDASQADLATVPDLVPNGMGAVPTGTVVKYSEGNPVD